MSESVRVLFPGQRDVLVDGARCGRTNELLTVETGTHTFSISGGGCTPESVRTRVAGTSPLAPKNIHFEQV
ncbi:MAG TPA: hypothetical protein VGR02_13360 [Thermoanaerobaculia bacterium]|jgi:hypothetical protein|nr:hypothetical protein [Thermoanaerobaculia bacterium]